MRESELCLCVSTASTASHSAGTEWMQVPHSMKIACGHVVRPHGLSVNRLARGVLSAPETSSLSPCGQPATSRKKLTSKQFPGEPAGEEGDFLSWTLCTAIQNRQSQQVLEIWGKRAREMWPGGQAGVCKWVESIFKVFVWLAILWTALGNLKQW